MFVTTKSYGISVLRGLYPLEHLKRLKGIRPNQFGNVLYKSEIEKAWDGVEKNPALLDDFIFSMTEVFHSEITNGKKSSVIHRGNMDLATIEAILYASKILALAHERRSHHALDEEMATAYNKFNEVFGKLFSAKVTKSNNLKRFEPPDKSILVKMLDHAKEKKYINDTQVGLLRNKIHNSRDHIIVLSKDILDDILFELPKLREAYLENAFPREIEPQAPASTSTSVANRAKYSGEHFRQGLLFPSANDPDSPIHRVSLHKPKTSRYSHRRSHVASSQRSLFQ